jgi:hypothetical protein
MTAESVRAILAGAKFQTRRLIEMREFGPSDTVGYDWTFRDRRALWNDYTTKRLLESKWCRFHVGDRLWVKEAWSHDAQDLDACRAAYEDAGGGIGFGPYYRATEVGPDTLRWISPLFMPRWASRLTLEVTEVRVQRLQEIGEQDARAEGVRELPLQEGEPGAWWTYDVTAGAALHGRDPTAAYRKGWDRINGKRAPWASNPWVWAITFQRVTP